MRPGETICKYFRILAADGTPVTGAVLGDLTLTAWHRPVGGTPATWTTSAALSEIVSGRYALTFLAPPTAGEWGLWIEPVTATRQIEFAHVGGETESQDFDSVGNMVSRPIIGITGQGTIGQQVAIELIAYRYRVLRFTFVDTDGNDIDMTAGTTYTNYKWSVRSVADQTATPPKFDQTTGITAGDGYVEVAVLEASSFFDALPEDASVVDAITLRHELVADLVAVTGESVSLVPSSVLTLRRREWGSG